MFPPILHSLVKPEGNHTNYNSKEQCDDELLL